MTKWNNQAPTVQMLGRWQPWHAGHQALFERLLAKTGQVCIMIRDTGGTPDNPFDAEHVRGLIHNALSKDYDGKYKIIVVPNIVHIGWGRGVGYSCDTGRYVTHLCHRAYIPVVSPVPAVDSIAQSYSP